MSLLELLGLPYLLDTPSPVTGEKIAIPASLASSGNLIIYGFLDNIASSTNDRDALSRNQTCLWLCIADFKTYDSEEIPIDDIDDLEEIAEAKGDDPTRE